jgi:hopanoid biosynthesis associated protein HpnK
VSGPRRLIVSGDDFGVADEVNEGIIRSHRDGILGQTSLMVTGAAAAHAVALAKETPSLAVGLHLVLAQGRPAAPPSTIPELVRADGAFHDTPIRNGLRYAWAYVRTAGRPQLVREIDAQLAAFAATGLDLAHVDGHLNMHLHPMVLPILLELAPRYGIRAMRVSRESLQAALRWDPGTPCERASRAPRSTCSPPTHRRVCVLPASCRASGSSACTRRARRRGVPAARHRDASAGVSEIYGHPATRQAAVMAGFQDGYDHAGEVAGLHEPACARGARCAGVELTSYRDLVRERG